MRWPRMGTRATRATSISGFAATAENITRLLSALSDFRFGALGLRASDFDTDTVIQLGQPPRRIDLLTAIDGVEFDACFARREQVELAGVRLCIIGLEDFKANKRAAGRLKDLADLESQSPPADGGSNPRNVSLWHSPWLLGAAGR